MEFIDLARQYQAMKTEIDQKLLSVMNKADFIMGSEVEEFEQRLAAYIGVKHVISCGSGTDALQLIFQAYGIGKGDAVFCPDMTFIASIEPACLLGAIPVFCDIEDSTFQISLSSLERQIRRVIQERKYRPRAIVAVDFLGNPAQWQELLTIARKYHLLLIEDAAQSVGAAVGQKKCGCFGDAAAASFFPTKPLGAFGDGGAVFTNDESVAFKIRSLRIHGKGKTKYDNERIGINSRLDNLQAAILNVKMNHLDREMLERQKRAQWYRKELQNVQFMMVDLEVVCAYAQFVICLENEKQRDCLRHYLRQKGIPTIVYYPNPLHCLPVFADVECYGEDFSASKAYAKRNVGLPFSPYMPEEEQELVIRAVNAFIEQNCGKNSMF